MILVALSLLGAATVLFVLTPVFRPETAAGAAPALDDAARELQDLEEKKLRLYESIKDLDFEKDAGKVSGEDYQNARDDYLGQVAEVLARIDALSPSPEGAPAPETAKRAEKSKGKGRGKAKASEPEVAPPGEGPRACAGCGVENPGPAKFCMACGRTLDLVCASCGTTLPDEAKFCLSCGKRVTE